MCLVWEDLVGLCQKMKVSKVERMYMYLSYDTDINTGTNTGMNVKGMFFLPSHLGIR